MFTAPAVSQAKFSQRANITRVGDTTDAWSTKLPLRNCKKVIAYLVLHAIYWRAHPLRDYLCLDWLLRNKRASFSELRSLTRPLGLGALRSLEFVANWTRFDRVRD